MNEYELMYILHPRLTADEANGAVERVNGWIAAQGGEVTQVDNWGRRRLAYPIDHNFEGTYVYTTLRMPPEGTRRLEQQLLITEDVIRHLLIRGIMPYEGAPPAESARSRPARAEPREPAPEPAPQAAEVEGGAPEEAAEATADASTEAEPEAEPARAAEGEAGEPAPAEAE